MENKLSEFIVQFRNVIPEDKYNQFIKLIDNKVFEFNDAMVVGDKIIKDIRNTDWCPLFTINEEKMTNVHWANYFQRIFKQSVIEYSHAVKIDITCGIKDIQILRYPIGGHYVPHVDHGSETPRTLSMVYFVNENYKGGELNFVYQNKKYEVKVEKNKLIVFPSTFLYQHSVNAVSEGTKYSVVSWAL